MPEIVEQADSIDYTPDVSLKHWVGAAERLYREVRSRISRRLPSSIPVRAVR